MPFGFDEPCGVATIALGRAVRVAPGKHIRISTRKCHRIKGRKRGSRPPAMSVLLELNWSYINENGIPNVESVMEMQDFWSGPYFKFVEKKVSREQLFDLTIAKEAKERLEREKPFGP
jgi:hypothetical protein